MKQNLKIYNRRERFFYFAVSGFFRKTCKHIPENTLRNTVFPDISLDSDRIWATVKPAGPDTWEITFKQQQYEFGTNWNTSFPRMQAH